MLYVNPATCVIEIIPEGVLHVGCVMLMEGADGIIGAGLIVNGDAGETHPVFLSLTVVV